MWVFIARSWQWNVTQPSSLMRGTVVMDCSLKMQLKDVAQDLHQKLQNDLALCYEAELSLDGIGCMTKACPVQAWKERLWKCTEANFPWIIPPLLQILSCGAGRNIHNDMMETRGPFLTEVVMLRYTLNPLYEISTEMCFSLSTAQVVSEYSVCWWVSLCWLSTYIF